jgi:geranylgeranyl reductase family protein
MAERTANKMRPNRRGNRRLVDYDVIVAGAGPAGAASATILAEAGLRVALVDQAEFPRDKVCGDFVSPIALQQLQMLGVISKKPIARANAISHAAVFLDGRHLVARPIPTQATMATGRVIPRKRLDNALFKRARSAGADVHLNRRVMSFTARRHDVQVSIGDRRTINQLTAHVLIGADGSNSHIARLINGTSVASADRIIAVRGYFDAVDGPADRADLYFCSNMFPGYCWLFPTGDERANVGIGALRDTLPPTSEHLRTELLHMIETDDALRTRLGRARLTDNVVGWPLTTYNGDRRITDDRVLLVGDAAGLINPLNGEGIQYALQSGIWAAQTILECAADDDFSKEALQPYARRVSDCLGRDFAVTRALVQLIRNKSLNPLWLKALRLIAGKAAIDTDYARVAGGVLAGILPARDALDIDVIRKTVEHSVVQVGADAAATSLTVQGILHAGINATQFAIEAANTMLHEDSRLDQWLVELMTRSSDLLAPNHHNRMEERHGQHVEEVNEHV